MWCEVHRRGRDSRLISTNQPERIGSNTLTFSHANAGLARLVLPKVNLAGATNVFSKGAGVTKGHSLLGSGRGAAPPNSLGVTPA